MQMMHDLDARVAVALVAAAVHRLGSVWVSESEGEGYRGAADHSHPLLLPRPKKGTCFWRHAMHAGQLRGFLRDRECCTALVRTVRPTYTSGVEDRRREESQERGKQRNGEMGSTNSTSITFSKNRNHPFE